MEYVFTEEERKRWNDILIGCLHRFIEICEKHNLTYFCVGGTVIGTVRHGGLIPWDDDIDVAMPRPDYDRFLEIAKTENMGDYEVASPEMKGYPYFFSKFCDANTSLIELENVPCLYGVYIDIFPIDGTAPTKEEAGKLMRKFRGRMIDVAGNVNLDTALELFIVKKDLRDTYAVRSVVAGSAYDIYARSGEVLHYIICHFG